MALPTVVLHELETGIVRERSRSRSSRTPPSPLDIDPGGFAWSGVPRARPTDWNERYATGDKLVPRAGGRWVSLLGSTEGPPRDHGPPRRSARDIANAVEPALEIVELRATEFAADLPSRPSAWLLIARSRGVPAQPSTLRE